MCLHPSEKALVRILVRARARINLGEVLARMCLCVLANGLLQMRVYVCICSNVLEDDRSVG